MKPIKIYVPWISRGLSLALGEDVYTWDIQFRTTIYGLGRFLSGWDTRMGVASRTINIDLRIDIAY